MDNPYDLSIPLKFGGPQPNVFGAPQAATTPLLSGAFIGDTRVGGNCNCQSITLTPHCNGTHTECAAHIVDDAYSIRDMGIEAFMPSTLVTVSPEVRPIEDADRTRHPVISDRMIRAAIRNSDPAFNKALIIRTLPNSASKRLQVYDAPSTPFLTVEAVDFICGKGFQHLLVDLPSIDPLDDGGALAAHRCFWGLNDRAVGMSRTGRGGTTITELIYVPNDVPEGLYLLNLQIAPFVSDATPSRPVIFSVKEANIQL
ncbi:MAG TPA: cyclase family protein [Kiritimatiellia bacterium]|nr:cyclase family protein [Kiritimatiellia bacterium]